MSGLEVVAIGASLIGSGIQAYSAYEAGQAEAERAEYEARQREAQAKESRAYAQREAVKRRREGDLLQSRQLALAAAAGGGTDTSILDVFGETAAETELAASTEIYKGETRALGLEQAAAVRRVEGQAAKSAAGLSAVSGIIGGIGSAAQGFARFGKSSSKAAPQTSYRYG